MQPTRTRPPFPPGTALLAALFVAACSASAPGGSGAPDAGDLARLPDAGRAGPDAVLTPHPPDGPRRGPVALAFDVADPDHDVGPFALERQDGDAWRPATVLSEEHDGAHVLVVWDSFTDAPFDGRVALRLDAKDPEGDVSAPLAVEVRNEPDADRLVVVGHNLVDDGSGGAVPRGHAVTVAVWNGLAPGTVGQPRRVDVGQGPLVLRAAPHGRAVAVLEDTDHTVSLLLTPLDAIAAEVTRSAPLQLPYGSPSDLRWSGDGRFLYVLGSSDGPQPASLWRFAPSEDLSQVGPPQALATLPGPPMAFDVDRVGGRFVVFCGSGGTGKEKLLLLGPDGRELARLEDDFAPPNALVVSPSGDTALMTASLFGDELRRFTLGAASLTQEGATVAAVASPQDVVFHPASTAQAGAALVSQLDHNRVSGLQLDATHLVPGAPVAGFPLAGEVDIIERGSQAGTVLVTGVSGTSNRSLVQRALLAADGRVTAGGTALELGDGTDRIPQGIAIQR